MNIDKNMEKSAKNGKTSVNKEERWREREGRGRGERKTEGEGEGGRKRGHIRVALGPVDQGGYCHSTPLLLFCSVNLNISI